MKTIALSADYAYLDKAETTIKSILYNNQYVKIYLFNYDIPQEWFVNINQYAKQIGSEIVDAKFDPSLVQDVHVNYKHMNAMTYARFLIPKIIPEDKVLYLDSDLVCDRNLDELFKLDFEGKSILAVFDIFNGSYVDQYNAGVMLINNAKLKQDPEISGKLLKLGQDPNINNADQTIINTYFKDDIGTLPLKYNYQVGLDKLAFWANKPEIYKLLDQVKDPVIIHYVLPDKPFNMLSSGRMREKWWFYHNLEMSKIVQKYTIFDISKIRKNKFMGELFTFTNSGNIQNLEALIQKLPNYHFNIAAWTDVSWNLKNLIRYPNVSIYVYVIGKHLNALIENADAYLDINYDAKDDATIKRVEDRNIPVLSFKNTANNKNEYQKYQIFENDQVDEMVSFIKNIN